jgi:nucleotide-binding universal stress UspA family protein
MQIILATDGSGDAAAGIDLVRDWPWRGVRQTAVVTVVPPLPRLGTALASQQPHESDDLASVATRIASDACAVLQGVSERCEPLVTRGNPADRILDAARERDADLIVLGAKGVSGIRQFLLGSVAENVVRHAPCSVLVVRQPARPLRTTVLGVDGSPGAETAIDLFETLLDPADTHVEPVLVLPPMEAAIWGTDPVSYAHLRRQLARYRREEEEIAHEIVSEVATRLSHQHCEAHGRVEVGDAVAQIIATARALDADLIVVGSRGRSPAAQRLLGSVALSTVREASCSVLVARQATD